MPASFDILDVVGYNPTDLSAFLPTIQVDGARYFPRSICKLMHFPSGILIAHFSLRDKVVKTYWKGRVLK
jgi:hypothetical protein